MAYGGSARRTTTKTRAPTDPRVTVGGYVERASKSKIPTASRDTINRIAAGRAQAGFWDRVMSPFTMLEKNIVADPLDKALSGNWLGAARELVTSPFDYGYDVPKALLGKMTKAEATKAPSTVFTEHGWKPNFITGLGLDIALDPLTWASLGSSFAAKAGVRAATRAFAETTAKSMIDDAIETGFARATMGAGKIAEFDPEYINELRKIRPGAIDELDKLTRTAQIGAEEREVLHASLKEAISSSLNKRLYRRGMQALSTAEVEGLTGGAGRGMGAKAFRKFSDARRLEHGWLAAEAEARRPLSAAEKLIEDPVEAARVLSNRAEAAGLKAYEEAPSIVRPAELNKAGHVLRFRPLSSEWLTEQLENRLLGGRTIGVRRESIENLIGKVGDNPVIRAIQYMTGTSAKTAGKWKKLLDDFPVVGKVTSHIPNEVPEGAKPTTWFDQARDFATETSDKFRKGAGMTRPIRDQVLEPELEGLTGADRWAKRYGFSQGTKQYAKGAYEERFRSKMNDVVAVSTYFDHMTRMGQGWDKRLEQYFPDKDKAYAMLNDLLEGEERDRRLYLDRLKEAMDPEAVDYLDRLSRVMRDTYDEAHGWRRNIRPTDNAYMENYTAHMMTPEAHQFREKLFDDNGFMAHASQQIASLGMTKRRNMRETLRDLNELANNIAQKAALRDPEIADWLANNGGRFNFFETNPIATVIAHSGASKSAMMQDELFKSIDLMSKAMGWDKNKNMRTFTEVQFPWHLRTTEKEIEKVHSRIGRYYRKRTRLRRRIENIQAEIDHIEARLEYRRPDPSLTRRERELERRLARAQAERATMAADLADETPNRRPARIGARQREIDEEVEWRRWIQRRLDEEGPGGGTGGPDISGPPDTGTPLPPGEGMTFEELRAAVGPEGWDEFRQAHGRPPEDLYEFDRWNNDPENVAARWVRQQGRNPDDVDVRDLRRIGEDLNAGRTPQFGWDLTNREAQIEFERQYGADPYMAHESYFADRPARVIETPEERAAREATRTPTGGTVRPGQTLLGEFRQGMRRDPRNREEFVNWAESYLGTGRGTSREATENIRRAEHEWAQFQSTPPIIQGFARNEGHPPQTLHQLLNWGHAHGFSGLEAETSWRDWTRLLEQGPRPGDDMPILQAFYEGHGRLPAHEAELQQWVEEGGRAFATPEQAEDEWYRFLGPRAEPETPINHPRGPTHRPTEVLSINMSGAADLASDPLTQADVLDDARRFDVEIDHNEAGELILTGEHADIVRLLDANWSVDDIDWHGADTIEEWVRNQWSSEAGAREFMQRRGWQMPGFPTAQPEEAAPVLRFPGMPPVRGTGPAIEAIEASDPRVRLFTEEVGRSPRTQRELDVFGRRQLTISDPEDEALAAQLREEILRNRTGMTPQELERLPAPQPPASGWDPNVGPVYEPPVTADPYSAGASSARNFEANFGSASQDPSRSPILGPLTREDYWRSLAPEHQEGYRRAGVSPETNFGRGAPTEGDFTIQYNPEGPYTVSREGVGGGRMMQGPLDPEDQVVISMQAFDPDSEDLWQDAEHLNVNIERGGPGDYVGSAGGGEMLRFSGRREDVEALVDMHWGPEEADNAGYATVADYVEGERERLPVTELQPGETRGAVYREPLPEGQTNEERLRSLFTPEEQERFLAPLTPEERERLFPGMNLQADIDLGGGMQAGVSIPQEQRDWLRQAFPDAASDDEAFRQYLREGAPEGAPPNPRSNEQDIQELYEGALAFQRPPQYTSFDAQEEVIRRLEDAGYNEQAQEARRHLEEDRREFDIGERNRLAAEAIENPHERLYSEIDGELPVTRREVIDNWIQHQGAERHRMTDREVLEDMHHDFRLENDLDPADVTDDDVLVSWALEHMMPDDWEQREPIHPPGRTPPTLRWSEERQALVQRPREFPGGGERILEGTHYSRDEILNGYAAQHPEHAHLNDEQLVIALRQEMEDFADRPMNFDEAMRAWVQRNYGYVDEADVEINPYWESDVDAGAHGVARGGESWEEMMRGAGAAQPGARRPARWRDEHLENTGMSRGEILDAYVNDHPEVAHLDDQGILDDLREEVAAELQVGAGSDDNMMQLWAEHRFPDTDTFDDSEGFMGTPLAPDAARMPPSEPGPSWAEIVGAPAVPTNEIEQLRQDRPGLFRRFTQEHGREPTSVAEFDDWRNSRRSTTAGGRLGEVVQPTEVPEVPLREALPELDQALLERFRAEHGGDPVSLREFSEWADEAEPGRTPSEVELPAQTVGDRFPAATQAFRDAMGREPRNEDEVIAWWERQQGQQPPSAGPEDLVVGE